MTVITTVTAAGGADMFAALFEESLKSNDMRVGEVKHQVPILIHWLLLSLS